MIYADAHAHACAHFCEVMLSAPVLKEAARYIFHRFKETELCKAVSVCLWHVWLEQMIFGSWEWKWMEIVFQLLGRSPQVKKKNLYFLWNTCPWSVWKHFENFFVIFCCQYRTLCLEICDLSINTCLWKDLLCFLLLIPKYSGLYLTDEVSKHLC